jgi:hypothetical protein
MFNCPAAYPRGADVIGYGLDTFENSAVHYSDVDPVGQSIASILTEITLTPYIDMYLKLKLG